MADLVELFDDFSRKTRVMLLNNCPKEFLIFVKNQEECRLRWKEAVEECQRLRGQLDKSVAQVTEYEKKLLKARKMLADEKRKADRAEEERDGLQQQISQVQEILGSICRAGNQLANETKEKLDKFLNTTNKMRHSDGLYPRLDTIDEINSTGSLLSDSDMSFSRSEDMLDIDTDASYTRRKKLRKSSEFSAECLAPPKRRRSARLNNGNELRHTSIDGLVATTTVSVPKSGPITASSRIEALPPHSKPLPSAPPASSASSSVSSASEAMSSAESESADDKANEIVIGEKFRTPGHAALQRMHEFVSRTVLRPSEECCVCFKSLPFATKILRCPNCKATCHLDCREQVPLPCLPASSVAVSGTPVANGSTARLVDYCRGASVRPFIPPILLRCVMEVERRGLHEVGLYRVPGSEKEVRELKARFLRGKGACSSLANFDINVICGLLKDFLRSLPEPLITHGLWSGFVDASQQSSFERTVALYQMISELPATNRDTLAFIILHLQKVAASPACKMSKSNLAVVFGPTLVGYSNPAPTNQEMCTQTPLQAMVVEALIDLSEDYWNNLLSSEQQTTPFVQARSFRQKNTGKSLKLFNTPPPK